MIESYWNIDQSSETENLQNEYDIDMNPGIPMDIEIELEYESDTQSNTSEERVEPSWDGSDDSGLEDSDSPDDIEGDNPLAPNNTYAVLQPSLPPVQTCHNHPPSSTSPPDPKLTTPALQALKKELLGDYRTPSEAPSEPFILPELDDVQKLSLKHYSAWQKSNGTVKAYTLHASVLAEATGTEILSLYKVEALAESITRLHPRSIDICPKSCIAYTGKYSHLDKCPYISSATRKECNTPRYSGKNPNRRQATAQYTVLPVKATIDALYANAGTSKLMRHRDNCKKAVLKLLGSASNGNLNGDAERTYSDFGDSYVHAHIHSELGLFQNPQDVAFTLSTDGAQLTMKKHSNTWILILIILNLPPEIRYRTENVIINFATPGPNSPGDIESFIRPLFEEMAQFSEGIWIWDAIHSAYFSIKACIAIAAGDMLGSAKINGMAGHAAIYGDRFSTVQAAKSSTASGSKAQYYPMLSSDKHNPNRPKYSYDTLPLREHRTYFETLRDLEAAPNENQRKFITRTTGVSRLPLCIASPAFFHPAFFPLDPFHLIYENCMAFIWDLWTIKSHDNEIMHISTRKAATLGILVTEAMATLPPAFCGPVRDPHLKRQSQYKIYEWMALLHWYLVPMGIELNFDSLILGNFAKFVRAMDYSMTSKPRSEDDLSNLYQYISEFLTDFERLYIGKNPDRNNRARLCLFQLIHIPSHIKWNGSIRIGSQATVERSIGEMGHKIRSKKSPFANLKNIIIKRERIKLLSLYYPDLSLNSGPIQAPPQGTNPLSHGKLFQSLPFHISDCKTGTEVFQQLALILNHIGLDTPGYHEINLSEDVQRWGKLRLLNNRVLHTELAYSPPRKEPARKSCWFRVSGLVFNLVLRILIDYQSLIPATSLPLFGLALAFYSIKIMEKTYAFGVYKKLTDAGEVLGCWRGKHWSTEMYVIDIDKISDLVGIWRHNTWMYMLQKHPGLDMLNAEESGRDNGDEVESNL